MAPSRFARGVVLPSSKVVKHRVAVCPEVVVCGHLMVMVMRSVTARMTMGSSVTVVVRLAQDQRANDVDQQTQHRHGFLGTYGSRSKNAFDRRHPHGRRHTHEK